MSNSHLKLCPLPPKNRGLIERIIDRCKPSICWKTYLLRLNFKPQVASEQMPGAYTRKKEKIIDRRQVRNAFK